jgi:hypothetical protein
MSGNAKASRGKKITYNGYVLAETNDVVEPKLTTAKDDVTDEASARKCHAPGDQEYSDLTFTVFAVDDTAQAALEALARAGTVGTWKVIYPSTFSTPFKTYVIPGFISGWEPTVKNNRLAYKMTITPSMDYGPAITTSGAALTTPFVTCKDSSDTSIPLTPTASATQYTLDGTALQAATHFHITPTATTGTIYVNGTIVATGADSAAINYALADYPTGSVVTIFVMVVESDTKTPKIYQIRITRGTA